MAIEITLELEQAVREAHMCSRGIPSTCRSVLAEYYRIDISITTVEGLFKKFNLQERRASDAVREAVAELYEEYGGDCALIGRNIPRKILFYNIGEGSVRSYILELGKSPGARTDTRSIGYQKRCGLKPRKEFRGLPDPRSIGKHL